MKVCGWLKGQAGGHKKDFESEGEFRKELEDEGLTEKDISTVLHEVTKAKKQKSKLIKPSGEFVGGFEGCKKVMSRREGVRDPEAVCAHIGRQAGKIK